MVIPAGKKVKIRENGIDIFEKAKLTGVEMILDNEVTLSLSSTFDELLNFNTNKMMIAGTSLFQAITGKVLSTQFKEMGYRMWTKTDPIKFSVTSTFNMTYSGKKEVLEPMQVLMKLPLPSQKDDGKGIGLLPPGPSILTAMNNDSGQFDRRYSFRSGIFYLESVVIEKAEPTFSAETDSEGFPIWGTIQLDISSLFTATTQDIDKFGKSSYNSEVNKYE